MDVLTEQIINLGIGAIALYALILVLNSQRDQDKAATVLATQLASIISSFGTAIDKQTEALNKGNGDLLILLTSQTANIVANTSAITQMTNRIQDDLMPGVTGLFEEQERKVMAEFRPVIEQLSKLYFSVRNLQEVIEAQQVADRTMADKASTHWQKEADMLANLRLQQSSLQTTLGDAAEKIGDIFAAVILTAHTSEAAAVAHVPAPVVEVADQAAAAPEPMVPTPVQVPAHTISDELDKTKSNKGEDDGT